MHQYTIHIPVNGPGIVLLIGGVDRHIPAGGSAIVDAIELREAQAKMPRIKARPMDPPKVKRVRVVEEPKKVIMERPVKSKKKKGAKNGTSNTPQTH